MGVVVEVLVVEHKPHEELVEPAVEEEAVEEEVVVVELADKGN